MTDDQDDVEEQNAAEAAAEGEFESSGAELGGDTEDDKPDLAEMGSHHGGGSTSDTDDAAVTTETDYRWRWLSTIWVLVYGLGFPAWVLSIGTDVGAALLSALILAWGGTVVYVIGPENVRAFRELRGGSSGGN